MVKIFKKLIICIVVLLLLFNSFACSIENLSSVYASGDDDSETTETETAVSTIENQTNALVEDDANNGFSGVIINAGKALAIAVGSIFEGIPYLILSSGGTATDIEYTYMSPLDIFFNEFPLTNVNVFSTSDLQGSTGLVYSLRTAIVGVFYIVEIVSLVILFVLIIIAFAKRFLSTNPEEKGNASNSITDCAWSIALVLFMNFIVIGVLVINEWLIGILGSIMQSMFGDGTGNDTMQGMIETLLNETMGGSFLLGVSAIIAYVMISWQTLKFTIQYIMRFFMVSFLIIISPIMGVFYNRTKAKNGSSGAFNRWFKYYISNVIVQPIDCLLYLIFVALPISVTTVAEGMEGLGASVLLIVGLMFVKRGEKLVMALFGMDDSVISMNMVTQNINNAISKTTNAALTGVAIAQGNYSVVNHTNSSISFGNNIGSGKKDESTIHQSALPSEATGNNNGDQQAQAQSQITDGSSEGHQSQSRPEISDGRERDEDGNIIVDENGEGSNDVTETGDVVVEGGNSEVNEELERERENATDAEYTDVNDEHDETHNETHDETHDEKETTVEEVNKEIDKEHDKKRSIDMFRDAFKQLLSEFKNKIFKIDLDKDQKNLNLATQKLDQLATELGANTYKNIEGKDIKFNAQSTRQELEEIYKRYGIDGIKDYINRRKDAPKGNIANGEAEYAKEFLEWAKKDEKLKKDQETIKNTKKKQKDLLENENTKNIEFTDEEMEDITNLLQGITSKNYDETMKKIQEILDDKVDDLNDRIKMLEEFRDEIIKKEFNAEIGDITLEDVISPEELKKLTKNKNFNNVIEGTMSPMQVVDGKIDVSYENVSRITTNFENGAYSDEKLEAAKQKIAKEGKDHESKFSQFCDQMNAGNIAEATKTAKGLTSEAEKEGVRLVTERQVANEVTYTAIQDYAQTQVNNNSNNGTTDSSTEKALNDLTERRFAVVNQGSGNNNHNNDNT